MPLLRNRHPYNVCGAGKQEIEHQRTELLQAVVAAFDEHLERAVPKCTKALPVRVRISVPTRRFVAENVVLHPTDTVAHIKAALMEKMGEEGRTIDSFVDGSSFHAVCPHTGKVIDIFLQETDVSEHSICLAFVSAPAFLSVRCASDRFCPISSIPNLRLRSVSFYLKRATRQRCFGPTHL